MSHQHNGARHRLSTRRIRAHGRATRLSGVALALVAGAALALPGAAAASSTSFAGTLLIHWPLKASQPFPCSGPGICGTGTLRGLGSVQITIDDEQFTEIPNSDCLAVQRSETITALDSSGTIVLDSTGIACPPGNSQSGPHFNSYGNPFVWELTFTVDGAESTGAYRGAAGAGTDRFQFAGATGVWMLSGSITTT